MKSLVIMLEVLKYIYLYPGLNILWVHEPVILAVQTKRQEGSRTFRHAGLQMSRDLSPERIEKQCRIDGRVCLPAIPP